MTEISKIKIDNNELILKDNKSREDILSLSTYINNNLDSLSTYINNNLDSLSTNINNNLDSLSTHILNYLPLNGGTLNGNLNIKQENWDISNTTLPNNYYTGLYLKDNNDISLGWLEGYQYTNGTIYNQIGVKKIIDNENFNNTLSLEINNEGLKTVTINNSLILLNNWQADGTKLSTTTYPPLLIGSINNNHLEFDNNKIISKSDEFTPSTLYFNYQGGNIYLGNKTYIQNNYNQNGIIKQATWNGDVIEVSYGGTGKTSFTTNQVLIGAGSDPITTRPIAEEAITAITPLNNNELITNNTLFYYKGTSNIDTVGTISTGEWNGTPISLDYGGTGATSRTTAVKNLFNEDVGVNTTHFLTIGSNWENTGYATPTQVWNILGGGAIGKLNTISADKITSGNLNVNRLPPLADVETFLKYKRFAIDSKSSKTLKVTSGIGILIWMRAGTYGMAVVSSANTYVKYIYQSGSSDPTITYSASNLKIVNNRESTLYFCAFGATI